MEGEGIMTKSERACQIWAVLAWAAECRQSMTYEQVAALVGVPRVSLGAFLEPIQSYCLLFDLPPLTVLVVSEITGLPGSGFTGVTEAEISRARVAVYAFAWLERRNPGAPALDQAVKDMLTKEAKGDPKGPGMG